MSKTLLTAEQWLKENFIRLDLENAMLPRMEDYENDQSPDDIAKALEEYHNYRLSQSKVLPEDVERAIEKEAERIYPDKCYTGELASEHRFRQVSFIRGARFAHSIFSANEKIAADMMLQSAQELERCAKRIEELEEQAKGYSLATDKRDAIGFAEWLYKNRWFSMEGDKWCYTFEMGTSIPQKTYEKNYMKTTAELYEIFKSAIKISPKKKKMKIVEHSNGGKKWLLVEIGYHQSFHLNLKEFKIDVLVSLGGVSYSTGQVEIDNDEFEIKLPEHTYGTPVLASDVNEELAKEMIETSLGKYHPRYDFGKAENGDWARWTMFPLQSLHTLIETHALMPFLTAIIPIL